MTPRERLVATLRHNTPDRVCVDFGASGQTGMGASQRPDLLCEEVSVPNRFDGPLDEVVPSASISLRPRIEAMLQQDATDCGPGYLADAELLELTQDSSVSPPRSRGHFENQLPDLFRFPRPATFARSPARVALAQPTGEGSRVDYADGVFDLRAEPHTKLHKSSPFCLGDVDACRQLVAKRSILGLQVFDDLDKVFFGGLGQEHQQGVEQVLHSG